MLVLMHTQTFRSKNAFSLLFRGSMTRHKTFRTYITRQKQGGSQSSRDNQGGSNIRSAGASLRRRNEASLQMVRRRPVLVSYAAGQLNPFLNFAMHEVALKKVHLKTACVCRAKCVLLSEVIYHFVSCVELVLFPLGCFQI